MTTTVNVDIRRPAQDGEDVPANGTLECRPTLRRTVDEYVVLPDAFSARLVDGKATLDLAPSTDEWAWLVTERINSGGGKRLVAVPDESEVNYADLVELDPDSFDPIAPPSPAWLIRADELQEAVDTKADASALAGKADAADLTALADTVAELPDAAAVTDLVGDALEDYAPGTELAYAEIHSTSPYTPYTNTQTSVATSAADVTGLSTSFIGTGRPVVVALDLSYVSHSVANTKVSAAIIVNGSVAAPTTLKAGFAGAAGSSGGTGISIRRRMNTVLGQTYTLQARVCGGVAGTTTVGITNTVYVPSSIQVVAC